MAEKAKFIWFDGKFIPWEQARVHVLTHTLGIRLGVFRRHSGLPLSRWAHGHFPPEG